MTFKLYISLTLCTLIGFPAQASDRLEDRLIIPGERVGFITHNTTEDDLKRLLPANQIKRILIRHEYGSREAPLYCETEVFSDSEKTLRITWDNSLIQAIPGENFDNYFEEAGENCKTMELRKPQSVSMYIDRTYPAYKKSSYPYWHTVDGIGLGSSLMQLEKANSAPISSYMGAIVYPGEINWNKGKFSSYRHKDAGEVKNAVNINSSYEFLLSGGLEYQYEYSLEPYQQGDGKISSADLPIHIKNSITLYYLTVCLKEDRCPLLK